MYCVYVIYSESVNKYYIGQTSNLTRRIEEHNTRNDRYTSNKGPWKLMYFEEFESRSEAMKREKFFKTGKGREYWKNKLLIE